MGMLKVLVDGQWVPVGGPISPYAIQPLTVVQRDALAGDALYEGRVIYNTDFDHMEMYDGTAWILVTGSAETGPTEPPAGGEGQLWYDSDDDTAATFDAGDLATGTIDSARLPLVNTRETTTTLTYTNGTLTSVTETEGGVTVKTTTLNYTGDQLTSTVEVADGKTVTTTLNYNGSGDLTSTTRTVA